MLSSRTPERADHHRNDVVSPSTVGDRGRARIAAALEHDAVKHRPGEDRAEQDDAAEIAVGHEMGHCPKLHPDQHRMLEHALDVAADIGGNHADHRRPHQRDRDMAGPCGRVPDRDRASGPILPKAVANENNAQERSERKEPLIEPLAQARDRAGALGTKRHEGVPARKGDKPEDHDGKSHGDCLEHFQRKRNSYSTRKPPDLRKECKEIDRPARRRDRRDGRTRMPAHAPDRSPVRNARCMASGGSNGLL
jgi:hypothetical protein